MGQICPVAGLTCGSLCNNFGSQELYGICYVGSALIGMYGKCGNPELGRQVFNHLPERNVVAWTSMIATYVQHEVYEEALKLFWQMDRDGVCPNEITFVTALKACCCAPALQSGYVAYGHSREALTLFLEMEQRGVKTNEVTFISVVKACANLHLLDFGKQVHLKYMETRANQNTISTNQNTILNNTVVDMYHKCGDIDGALKVFSDLAERDAIAWNIVMAGHAIRDNMEEVFVLYRQMQQEGVQPDGVSFLSMLLACANLGAIELGEQFHACVIGGHYEIAMPVSNTLIDMYAKCGSIEKAIHVFHNMAIHTSVSWNIVITGCAQHGCGKKALQLFEQMQQEEVKLDNVTLVAIITACSHAGLLADGCYYFGLMTLEYGIIPGEEAVASMVDLLGRAGHLKAAKLCMEETGCTTFAVVWKSLLSACRIHGDWKLAKLAADSVLALEPEDAGAFVLWSNICAENG